MNDENARLLLGNCLEKLKEIPSDSIDLIASDPPYQLSSPKTEKATSGFMGKDWDILPQIPTLQECLRVLKDGAFSFWLMTPRQDSYCEFVVRLKQAEIGRAHV